MYSISFKLSVLDGGGWAGVGGFVGASGRGSGGVGSELVADQTVLELMVERRIAALVIGLVVDLPAL